MLLPMRHKLQWNYQQAKPKAILPEELAAMTNLKSLLDAHPAHPLIVRITGPLAVMPASLGHGTGVSVVTPAVTSVVMPSINPAIEVRTFSTDDGRTPSTMPTATTKPSVATIH